MTLSAKQTRWLLLPILSLQSHLRCHSLCRLTSKKSLIFDTFIRQKCAFFTFFTHRIFDLFPTNFDTFYEGEIW
jgi:hypothetical protein